MTQLENTSMPQAQSLTSAQHMDLVARCSANNYAPLPVVIARGEGAWVWDADGQKYLDCLSAYSALNFGHSHPRVLNAFIEQAEIYSKGCGFRSSCKCYIKSYLNTFI